MSRRNNDVQGRFRNKIVAVRVSPEEDEVLDRKVSLSGLTKQDYIIKMLTDRTVTVPANQYVIRSMREEIKYFVGLVKDSQALSEDDKEVYGVLVKELSGFNDDHGN